MSQTLATTLPTGVRAKTRKDGTPFYEATVSRPNTPEGKRQSALSRSFDSPQEAAAWRADELAKRDGTALDAPHTLSSWAAAWLPTTGHLGAATRRSYADLIRLHVAPTLGHRALTDIKPSQLSALYAHLATTRARATVVKTHAATLQLLKAAVEDGLIPVNPATAAKLPKRTLTDKGRQRTRPTGAWDAATTDKFLSSEAVIASPLHALFTVAFRTGLRRGELLALLPADLTLTGPGSPALRVNRALVTDSSTTARVVEVPKSTGSLRRVPLSASAVAAVNQALAHRATAADPDLDPELFVSGAGRALTADHVSKAFASLARAFAIANQVEPITMHGARHSFVTQLLTQGVPLATVSKLAGHADSAFTVRQYGHLLPDAADDAILALA